VTWLVTQVETMTEIHELAAEYWKRQRSLRGDIGGAAGPEDACRAVLGFDPPCGGTDIAVPIETRLSRMHEVMRARLSAQSRLDARVAHLALLAMLIKDHGADALAQAVAARRVGASWDDIRCVAGLAFALFGDRGALRGEELLQALADWEQRDRVAGAVAAYG
jgi:hypothetical protein